jgi:hypothetical protein
MTAHPPHNAHKIRAQQWLLRRQRCIRSLEMLAAAAAIAMLLALGHGPARSAEYENVEPTPPLIEQYRQPNLRDKGGRLLEASRSNSCCGRADAYWADEFERDEKGHLVAIITDPRDDDLFRGEAKEGESRVHLPIGTRIPIPDEKVITFEEQPSNTTGHGWVWASVYVDEVDGRITAITVICYLYPEQG